MRFLEQGLPGVFIIEPEPFVDSRGVFRRNFCQNEFRAHGITGHVAQCNVSENKFKYTLRGFHYQLPPFEEAKTMSCLVGKIYDIVVDLRPRSATFLKWQSFELDQDNRMSIHVPPGCANAFLTMADNCLIHYSSSQFYCSAAEKCIRYNDPLFKFVWPVEPQIISDKDRNHPDFVPERAMEGYK